MSARALLLEAHHTSHIEGTELTLEEAARLWAGESVPGVDRDDVRELLNYRDAFNLVSDYLGSGEPITEGLIREIHKRLAEGVRGGAGGPARDRGARGPRPRRPSAYPSARPPGFGRPGCRGDQGSRQSRSLSPEGQGLMRNRDRITTSIATGSRQSSTSRRGGRMDCSAPRRWTHCWRRSRR
jgi:hypothetical protein